jgi:GAF domain-containing protein
VARGVKHQNAEGRPPPVWAVARDATDLSRHIGSPDLLRMVVELGCDAVAASFGSVVSMHPDGIGDLVTDGVPLERQALRDPDAGDGILEMVRSRRRPVRACVDDDPCLDGFPRDDGGVHVLAVPIAVGDELIGALWVARQLDHGGFTDDEEEALALFARQAALVVDNARLRAGARAWEAVLSGVKDCSHALLEGRATDEVLVLVARSARHLLSAALTTIAVEEPSGHILIRVADGHHAHVVQRRRVWPAGSAAGEVMRTRRPLVVSDVAKDAGHFPQVAGLDGAGPPCWCPWSSASGCSASFRP